jgi:DNA-binding PadR family transcriptional regulator
MVMLALLRLGQRAYGLAIAEEIEGASGSGVALSSVYATLNRLEEIGVVTSELGDPTPERGGRAKRYFRVTAKGLQQVRAAQRTLVRLWHNLPHLEGHRA